MKTMLVRVLTIAAVLVLGGSSRAFACPVCFGAEETSMIEGSLRRLLPVPAQAREARRRRRPRLRVDGASTIENIKAEHVH
jgi:hypothetical protein